MKAILFLFAMAISAISFATSTELTTKSGDVSMLNPCQVMKGCEYKINT